MKAIADEDQHLFETLAEVRAEALDHMRKAHELSLRRREIIAKLVGAGYSHADIGRELGVSRQSVQKMMSAGGQGAGE